MSPRSSASRARPKRRRLSAMCSAWPRRAPMMTPPTEGSSSTTREATFAMVTPCLRATRLRRAEHRLAGRPPSGGANEAPVFHLRPRLEAIPVRFARVEPSLRQEPARERAEREQGHPVLAAEGVHAVPGALVEEREAHLVGDNRDAAAYRDAEVRRVEVRQPEVRDAPVGLNLREPRTGSPASSGPRSSRRGTGARRSGRAAAGPAPVARRPAPRPACAGPGAGTHFVRTSIDAEGWRFTNRPAMSSADP